MAIARKRPPRSWANVALAAGYHDQSHFIRDCREFASCSPSRLRATNQPLTESFLDD
jgi:AraC-like DNA-binding protein